MIVVRVYRGLPRQFWLMKENCRCSVLFHLLVPARQVAHADLDAEFACELLQLHLPQPDAVPVGTTAVGGDEQLAGLGVALLAEELPPAPDALDRIHATSESHFDSRGNPSAQDDMPVSQRTLRGDLGPKAPETRSLRDTRRATKEITMMPLEKHHYGAYMFP